MKHITSLIQGSFLALSFAASAHADTLIGGVTLEAIPGLGDDSTFATWNNLRIYNAATGGVTGTGGFPGMTMWSPIAPQGGDDADSRLSKIANGPGGGAYAASSSFYFGGFSGDFNYNGGTLGVGSTAPLSNLDTVIFQIQIGEAWAYDFYNDVLPTLTYTTSAGTVSGVASTYSSLYHQHHNGTVTMPTGEEDVYINSYALQWSLNDVAEEITSFQIAFSAVQHAQLYGVSLQQGNDGTTVNLLPVPEPSTALLGVLGLLASFRRRR